MWNWFRRIERKIDLILDGLNKGEIRMSKELDDLTAEVTQVQSVEQSAVTLIHGLADQITAAGTDPAKLAALTTSLKASADALATAVATNTVASPALAP